MSNRVPKKPARSLRNGQITLAGQLSLIPLANFNGDSFVLIKNFGTNPVTGKASPA